MTNHEQYEFFIDQLFENAVQAFRDTEQSRLLQEKLNKMDSDCDYMLKEDEKDFVTECFELLMEVDGQQDCFVYHKAFRDCVRLLKWLGVLA